MPTRQGGQAGKELKYLIASRAGPVTFAVGDKQYVAILTGRPVGPPAYMGEAGKSILSATPQGGTLFVFSL
jgi:alcohol dehydrogenase (cytochrome c)